MFQKSLSVLTAEFKNGDTADSYLSCISGSVVA